MARATASASSSSRSSWAGRSPGARPGTYSKRAASASSGPSGPEQRVRDQVRVHLEPLLVVQVTRDDHLGPAWTRQQETLQIVQRGAFVAAHTELLEQAARGHARWRGPHALLGHGVQTQHAGEIGGGGLGVRDEASHSDSCP